MSNFFEQELRKLFADGTIIRDPVFVGRACLGSLDRNRQVRAEFVTLGHADHYAALRLTLLDNNHGVVDKLILRFKDIWGKKKIPNNPYLRDGVAPHIWVSSGAPIFVSSLQEMHAAHRQAIANNIFFMIFYFTFIESHLVSLPSPVTDSEQEPCFAIQHC